MGAMRMRYPAGISRNTVLLSFASLFADISSEMLYPIYRSSSHRYSMQAEVPSA
jgi:hypothetical protein